MRIPLTKWESPALEDALKTEMHDPGQHTAIPVGPNTPGWRQQND